MSAEPPPESATAAATTTAPATQPPGPPPPVPAWRAVVNAALRSAVSDYPIEKWRACGPKASANDEAPMGALELASIPGTHPTWSSAEGGNVPLTWRRLRERADDVNNESIREALHVYDNSYFRGDGDRARTLGFLLACEAATVAAPADPRNADHAPWFACAFCGAASAVYSFLAGRASAANDDTSMNDALLWRYLSGRTHTVGEHGFSGADLVGVGAMRLADVRDDGGRWFSHILAHRSTMHLVANCALMLAIGASIERRYGTTRFALLCFVPLPAWSALSALPA